MDNQSRRTVRDYERLPGHHETMVWWAMIITMSRRRLAKQSLPPQARPAWSIPAFSLRQYAVYLRAPGTLFWVAPCVTAPTVGDTFAESKQPPTVGSALAVPAEADTIGTLTH
jgi:hypothetical protein